MKLHETTVKVLEAIRNDPRATLRELMDACGLASTSVVHYHLVKLEEAGEITRRPGARGIYIGERRRGNTSGRYEFHMPMDKISEIRKKANAARKRFAQGVKTRRAKRDKSGDGPLTKLSAAELEARIEMVARKAEGRHQTSDIRHQRSDFGGQSLVKAHKVG